MKSLAPLLSIIALVVGLVGCPGGGGGGGSAADFAVSTTAADFGVVDNSYTSTLAVTGGTAPFTWTLFGGTLPTGLSLNAGTGVVSGTPTVVENPTAVFTVTDSTGKTATGSVLFAVHPRTDRASVTGSGTAGSGASSAPSISGAGNLITFASSSTNFVTGVIGTQIYLHNRQTNQIEVVSRDSDASVITEGGAASSDPSMSSDGRLVAFVSLSSNLVTSVSGQQIYVRDRQTDQTSVVSKSSAGTIGDGTSNAPAISADGRYVAFVSTSGNLVLSVSGTQIYVHDRQTNQTILVSRDTGGNAGNGASSQPTISADGRFVAFTSAATNLASITGGQIFLRDTIGNATTLVSRDTTGNAGNGASSAPSISADARYVAFVSQATNLLAPDPVVLGGQQVYIHDRQLGQSSLASQDNTNTNIEGAGGVSDTPSMSSDGGFVAFFSQATNLVAGSGAHIYIRALP